MINIMTQKMAGFKVCTGNRQFLLSSHSRYLYCQCPGPAGETMGFAVRVRSAGQKYGPMCHQRDRADVTEFVTLVRLSSLGQHVGVLALAGYKRRKSALMAGPIKWSFSWSPISISWFSLPEMHIYSKILAEGLSIKAAGWKSSDNGPIIRDHDLRQRWTPMTSDSL